MGFYVLPLPKVKKFVYKKTNLKNLHNEYESKEPYSC